MAKRRQIKNRLLMFMGILLIACWLLDFIHNAVLKNNYSWILWYSPVGLLLTGIALIIQNDMLISSLFCALFVVEVGWAIDFFYNLFHRTSVFGFTQYILSPTFRTDDLLFTLYHLLIPAGLLFAIWHTKKIYRYGWIGAAVYISVLILLTYFFTSPFNQVNCIHSLVPCRTVFSFLYTIDMPLRIGIVLFSFTAFIYFPTNYALMYLKKNQLKKTQYLGVF